MRPGPLAAALTLATLLAAVPHAAGHGETWRTYIVTAHEGELENQTVAWFTLDANPDANPDIHVHPGDTLLIHFVNLEQNAHNHTLQFGPPLHNTTGPIPPGNETSLQLDIPPNLTHAITYEDPTWTRNPIQGHLVPNQTRTNQTPLPSAPNLLALTAFAALAIATARKD